MQATKPKRRKNPLDDDAEFANFVKNAEPNFEVVGTSEASDKSLSGSDSTSPAQMEYQRYPWEGKSFTKTLKPFMNFSLDGEYIEKLRWVSNHSNVSQMEIIRVLLRPYLDKYISENSKAVEADD